LLADEFVEVGNSGRVYDKAAIIAELATEPPIHISISGFHAAQLAQGLVLVTYRAVMVDQSGGESHSMRSSIWKLNDETWQMLFHQGTPTEKG
jgi:hypothetical protein